MVEGVEVTGDLGNGSCNDALALLVLSVVCLTGDYQVQGGDERAETQRAHNDNQA